MLIKLVYTVLYIFYKQDNPKFQMESNDDCKTSPRCSISLHGVVNPHYWALGIRLNRGVRSLQEYCPVKLASSEDGVGLEDEGLFSVLCVCAGISSFSFFFSHG